MLQKLLILNLYHTTYISFIDYVVQSASGLGNLLVIQNCFLWQRQIVMSVADVLVLIQPAVKAQESGVGLSPAEVVAADCALQVEPLLADVHAGTRVGSSITDHAFKQVSSKFKQVSSKF